MVRRRLYEGKAKILFKGPEAGTLIQHFKDDVTAFDNRKTALFQGKGVINNRISEYLFVQMERIGIANHFIRRLNMREQVIHEMEMLPLEVVVRNVAAGSLAKRFGLDEGTALPRPVIEFYYKSDSLGDPLINEDHILAFGWANVHDIEDMVAMAQRSNDFLTGLFLGARIRLIDFKLEFGRVYENDMARLLIGDEISPDSCRLWDVDSEKKLDKDRFRRDLGEVIESYGEVARRLGVLIDNEVGDAADGKDKSQLTLLSSLRSGQRTRPQMVRDTESPHG